MDRTTLRRGAALCVGLLVLGLAGCSGSPLSSASAPATVAATPVYDAWSQGTGTTTAYAAPAAQPAALQPAPRPMGGESAPMVQSVADRGAVMAQDWAPPLPPPPDTSMPVVGAPTPGPAVAAPGDAACPPCAPPATTTQMVAPERTYSGCWPPCNDGISQWHGRAVVGRAFSSGTDHFIECSYYGADVGRTFCGCWGLDLYWRYNTGRFHRDTALGTIKDGGEWHHFGGKVGFARSLGRDSKLYAWAGLGAGYFTTNKYIQDDSGFEVFGEGGIGYNISQNWRVRAGVNVHGMDTDVTRRLPADDGSSRWLWIIAPVIELEGSF